MHINTKKIIAIVTTITFLLTGHGDVLISVAGAQQEIAATTERNNINIDSFSMPRDLGTIKDKFICSREVPRGKSTFKKSIIHIQDAHCNYAAQLKIAEILEYLKKNYDIEVINLEGGSGSYDLSLFTQIKDMRTRRKIADYFMKEGELNGAEYFKIMHPDEVALWGVEDKELYLKNLKVFRKSLSYKKEVAENLEKLNKELNRLKANIYTKELLEFDRWYESYKKNNINFKEYLLFLMREARNNLVNMDSLSNVNILSQLIDEETDIDFKKSNSERNALMDELAKKLPVARFGRLTERTVNFKRGKIAPLEFYKDLLRESKFVGIDVQARYKQLPKYIVYISMYDALDRSSIMDEIDIIENRIRASLYKSEEQKQLGELSKRYVLMANIFNYALTRNDYRYYQEHLSDFKIAKFIELINKISQELQTESGLDDTMRAMDDYLQEASEFFAYSFKRDDAFMENIKLPENNGKISVVITGGFHSENLCDLFAGKNIEYVSIIPEFKSLEGVKNSYFDILAGKATGFIGQINDAVSAMQVASLWNGLGREIDARRAELIEAGVLAFRDMERTGKGFYVEVDTTSEGGKHGWIVFDAVSGRPKCYFSEARPDNIDEMEGVLAGSKVGDILLAIRRSKVQDAPVTSIEEENVAVVARENIRNADGEGTIGPELVGKVQIGGDIAHMELLQLISAGSISRKGVTDIGRIKQAIKDDPDTTVRVFAGGKVFLDNELLVALENRMDLPPENIIKIIERQFIKTPPRQQEIVIAQLDSSEHLFEDEKENGFIGINAQLCAESVNGDMVRRILVLGLRHELQHEAGRHDEALLLQEDVTFARDQGIDALQLKFTKLFKDDSALIVMLKAREDYVEDLIAQPTVLDKALDDAAGIIFIGNYGLARDILVELINDLENIDETSPGTILEKWAYEYKVGSPGTITSSGIRRVLQDAIDLLAVIPGNSPEELDYKEKSNIVEEEECLEGEYTAFVNQRDAVVSKGGKLVTMGLGPCIGVALWDRKTKTGALVHFDRSQDAEFLPEIINTMGSDKSDIRVSFVLGTSPSFNLLHRLKTALIKQLEIPEDTKITRYKAQHGSVIFDIETGDLKSYMGALPADRDRNPLTRFTIREAGKVIERKGMKKPSLIGKVTDISGDVVARFDIDDRAGEPVTIEYSFSPGKPRQVIVPRSTDKSKDVRDMAEIIEKELVTNTYLSSAERDQLSELLKTLNEYRVVVIKDVVGDNGERIRGAIDPDKKKIYLTESIVEAPLSFIHELGEGMTNPEGMPDVITRHTAMRGVGKDVRNAYDAISNDIPDKVDAGGLITLLEGAMRDADYLSSTRSRDGPMTDSEKALISYNFAMREEVGYLQSFTRFSAQAALFGMQDRIDLFSNQEFTKGLADIKKKDEEVGPPINFTDATNGLAVLQEMLDSLPDALMRKLEKDTKLLLDLMKSFSGIAPEQSFSIKHFKDRGLSVYDVELLQARIRNSAGFLVFDNGLRLNKQEEEKENIIYAYPDGTVIGPEELEKLKPMLSKDPENKPDGYYRFQMINISAASRVIRDNPEYFPQEARDDPMSWLEQNRSEWDIPRDGSGRGGINEIRYGLLSGFPVNAVEKYVFGYDGEAMGIGSPYGVGWKGFDESDVEWQKRMDNVFVEAVKAENQSGRFKYSIDDINSWVGEDEDATASKFESEPVKGEKETNAKPISFASGIGEFSDELVRDCRNIIITRTSFFQRSNQEKWGRKAGRKIRKMGADTMFSGYQTLQDLKDSIREALSIAGEDDTKDTLIYVNYLMESMDDEGERKFKEVKDFIEGLSPDQRERIVLQKDVSATKQSGYTGNIDDFNVDVVKVVSFGTIMLNDKRISGNVDSTDAALVSLRRRLIEFIKQCNLISEFDTSLIELEEAGMTPAALQVFMMKLMSGEILLRLTPVNFEEISEYNDSMEQVYRSL